MAWLGLFVILFALTVIGLMPGSIYDREFLVVLVLVGVALWLLVFFLRVLGESVGKARQTRRKYDGWKSPQDRRQDLRLRRRASSPSRSRSRVFEPRSDLGSGRPWIRQADLRHQEQLRVKQGRRDAARKRANSRRHGEFSDWAEDVAQIDEIRQPIVNRPSARQSGSPQLSQAAERRQEELRVEQGRRYAEEANFQL